MFTVKVAAGFCATVMLVGAMVTGCGPEEENNPGVERMGQTAYDTCAAYSEPLAAGTYSNTPTGRVDHAERVHALASKHGEGQLRRDADALTRAARTGGLPYLQAMSTMALTCKDLGWGDWEQ